MEEKYGKKLSTLKVSGMIYLPTVMVTLLVSVVFGIFMFKAINGTGSLVVAIILGIVEVAAIYVLLRQIIRLKLEVYDKHLVEYNMFGTRVIAAEDIRAMIWQFPGVNPMNPRAARINNTSAEFIFKDNSKTLKLQDSYYQDMEKELSAFQSRNGISKNLEVQKKGGRRYDDI